MRDLLSCYLCMSCRLVFKVTPARVFNAAVFYTCYSSVLENRVSHWCVLELLATASVSVFGISGGLSERQVRKMACHFTPPSEFRTPQKRQLRFALRKRPYAEVFGTFYRHRTNGRRPKGPKAKYEKKRHENKYKTIV